MLVVNGRMAVFVMQIMWLCWFPSFIAKTREIAAQNHAKTLLFVVTERRNLAARSTQLYYGCGQYNCF